MVCFATYVDWSEAEYGFCLVNSFTILSLLIMVVIIYPREKNEFTNPGHNYCFI